MAKVIFFGLLGYFGLWN